MKRIRFGVPDSGRAAALAVLHARLEEGILDLTLLLEQQTAQLDPRDSRLARAMVYGVLTRLYTIDFLLQQRSRKHLSQLHPWVRTNLRLGIWQLRYSKQIPPSAVCDEACKAVAQYLFPEAVSFVNACLRSEVRNPTHCPNRRWDLTYSLPPELVGLFKQNFGDEGAKAELEALLEVPPLTIRCQTGKLSLSSLAKRLQEEGVECGPGSFHPQALTIQLKGKRLTELPSFQEGLFFVQGEAAMTVGSLLPLPEEARVLDLCSAPGGKLTHLLDLYPNLQVVAREPIPERLAQIEENLKRLRLPQEHCVLECAAAEDLATLPVYDLVLADVPCSGLGLIARKPEIRFTMNYERIQSLLPIQAEILDRAASAVCAGGYLLYSTCTLTSLENQEQVAAFLQRHQEFAPVPLDSLLPSALLVRLRQDPEAEIALSAGQCTFRPSVCHCEGFFLALLKRMES